MADSSSGTGKWAVAAVAGLAAVGGALFYFKTAGARYTLEALAHSVPGRAFMCVEVDVRDQKPWPELERQLADSRHQNADVDKSCKELEAKFGLPLPDLIETFGAAGYVALMPPAGKTEIDVANRSHPLDAVLVVPVQHHDRAESILTKARPAGARDQKVGNLTFTTEPKSGAVYTLSAHGLLIASSSEILKEAVDAFEEHKSTLADSAQFKKALSQVSGLGGSLGGLLFLDHDQVWNSLGKAFPAYVDQNSVAALHALPYSISGYFLNGSGWRGEGFLPVTAGNDAFTKAMLNPPKGNPQLAGLVPSAWGAYQSVQFFYSFDSLSELIRIFPLGSVGLNMGLGKAGAVPGNPVYDRVRQTFTGEVAYALDLPTLFQSAAQAAPGGREQPKLRGAMVLGLRSADKAAEFEKFLLRSGGVKPEAIKIGSHEAFRLAAGESEACWSVTPAPPALVLSFGPQARESVGAVLELAAQPQSSLAQHPVFNGLLRGTQGTLVSSQFLDLRALAAAVKSLQGTMEKTRPGSTKDWGLLANLDPEKFQAQAGYTAVEQNGVRFVSTGGGVTEIAVVSVLAAILVPNFVKARGQGMTTACKSNEKNMATALEMYAADNAGVYPLTLKKLTPEYLKVIPTCPDAGQDTYSASYRVSTRPDSFSFCCQGQHHAEAGLPANYPAYNAEQGLRERP